MDFSDYTVVLGVDEKHLAQLELVVPTWKRHKPSLFKRSWVVFYHGGHGVGCEIRDLILDQLEELVLAPWPPVLQRVDFEFSLETMIRNYQSKGVDYSVVSERDMRFFNPHRFRMLSGFLHSAAEHVSTPYWLKLDLDVVATGQDDWIDESWFDGDPAIVSQPWGYTKPVTQIQELNLWAEEFKDQLPALQITEPLDLKVPPDSDKIRHPRIISWCGFFHTGFTNLCAQMANTTVGQYRMPVPSQDGFMWYVAARTKSGIVRPNMKERGWQHWSTMRNVRLKSQEALQNG